MCSLLMRYRLYIEEGRECEQPFAGGRDYLGTMCWRMLLFATLALALPVEAQHPVIQQLINDVSADSLVWRMERLTGEVPVDVGEGEVLILSRHKNQPGNALAAQWLQQELARMGYTPMVQSFGPSGENVLAIKEGALYPERKVVIGAHYDCMPGVAVAPGADDDGSGVCAVLEAARVMAGLVFENTVVFALWDEEEQGLIGSAYHAATAAGNDEEIVAVVTMDAIGHDGDGDGLMRIHTGPVANSIAIKDSALVVNGTYGLDLPIAINNPGATYSDHASFWNQGYGAILVIEDFDDDPNPHYHTANDRMEYLDTAYWRGLARLAIGTAAAMAVPASGTGVGQGGMEGRLAIAPNPTHGHVEVRLRSGQGDGLILTVLDALGREMPPLPERVAQTAQGWLVDLSGHPPGLYLIRVAGRGQVLTGRALRQP